MSSIREKSWKDLLRVPTFDLGVDGEIIMPRGTPYPLAPYILVVEAPGKHIMGFISTSVHKDGNSKSLIVSIDKCRANRLYEQVEPMEALIRGIEKILLETNVISALEVCLHEETSSKMIEKYGKLDYETVVKSGERIILRKNIRETQEAVEAQKAVEAQIDAEQQGIEKGAAAAEKLGAAMAAVAVAGQVEAAAAEDAEMAQEMAVLLARILKLDSPGQRVRRASREETEETGSPSTSYATLPPQLPRRR